MRWRRGNGKIVPSARKIAAAAASSIAQSDSSSAASPASRAAEIFAAEEEEEKQVNAARAPKSGAFSCQGNRAKNGARVPACGSIVTLPPRHRYRAAAMAAANARWLSAG